MRRPIRETPFWQAYNRSRYAILFYALLLTLLLMIQAKGAYDVVIVDTPALSSGEDAAMGRKDRRDLALHWNPKPRERHL